MNIIFDLDGTLWDSSETILKAWEIVFKKEKILITLDEVKHILGLTNEEIINWLFLNKILIKQNQKAFYINVKKKKLVKYQSMVECYTLK